MWGLFWCDLARHTSRSVTKQRGCSAEVSAVIKVPRLYSCSTLLVTATSPSPSFWVEFTDVDRPNYHQLRLIQSIKNHSWMLWIGCGPGSASRPSIGVFTAWLVLDTCYRPVSSVPGRRHLRFAESGQLDLPRFRLTTYGGRAFTYSGPTILELVSFVPLGQFILFVFVPTSFKTFLFSSCQYT